MADTLTVQDPKPHGNVLKLAFYHIIEWLGCHLPSFNNNMGKKVRKVNVAKYSRYCFIFTLLLVCVGLPLWNALSRTQRVFKLTHYFKHHIFRSQSWIHRSPLYHNQSFHQFLLWSIIAGVPTFYGVNNDLLQVTKRMGRIAVALMPPLLFLTLRPSPLPETLYLALIPIHKWISRVVVVESLLHTVFYVWYMLRNKSLITKIKKLPNIYGVIAMVLFMLIGVTSLKKIRRQNFKLFYSVHYVSTWFSVILIHFHARPGVPYYTAMNCVILICQILYRVFHTKITTITAINISKSLTLVEFPLRDLSSKPVLPSGHVRLSIYEQNWFKRWLYYLIPLQHPYTIASLPTDQTVKLVVRNGRFPVLSNRKYRLTGAFEPRFTFMRKPTLPGTSSSRAFRSNPFRVSSGTLLLSRLNYNISARRVLMCVGGSAISFALPLLRILNFNGVNVKLMWVVRDYKDLKVLHHFKNNFDGMEIFISGSSGSEQDIQIDYIDCYGNVDSSTYLSSLGFNTTASRKPVSLPATPPIGEMTPLEGNAANQGMPSKGNGYGSVRDTNQGSDIGYVGAVDPDDEVDFTHTFSVRNVKSHSHENLKLKKGMSLSSSDIFRKPSIIEPPPSDASVSSGDESNGEGHRESDESDAKLRIPSGVKVFFGRPTLGEAEYSWCLQRECDAETATDLCCRLNNEDGSHVDDLSEVVVIAAGPPSLIESTRRFATDAGLHFHAESFAV